MIQANGAAPGGVIFSTAPLGAAAGNVAAMSQTMIVNPGGVAVTGVLNATGTLSTAAGIVSNGNYVGLASGAFMQSDASYTYFRCDTGGWGWVYTRSNGNMQYQRGSDYVNLFNIDGLGNITAPGNLSLAGSEFVNGYARASQGYYPDTSGNWRIFSDGSSRQIQWSPSWNWWWTIASGVSGYSTPGGSQWVFSNDWTSINWLQYVGGNGAYVNVSDERTKVDIAEAPHGLDHILALRPITFRRVHAKTKKHHDRTELGFSAQQLRDVLPEAVVSMNAPEEWRDVADSLMGMAVESVVAAMANAIKTLHARIETLEQRTIH